MTQTETEIARAIERIRVCQQRNGDGNVDQYEAELTPLVDEYGADFVAAHTCQIAYGGGPACPAGSCLKPDNFGTCSPDEMFNGVRIGSCTCQDGMRSYIDGFIGSPVGH
jgi:hypothetical protein